MLPIERRSQRRPLLEVILACLGVLLLAQALIGSLSLSALNRLIADTTADRVELMARQTAGEVQNGLRLGKPLAQYFGLDALLRTVADETPDVRRIAVVLPDGTPVAGQPPGEAGALLARLAGHGEPGASGIDLRGSGAAMRVAAGEITLAVPLRTRAGQLDGALLMMVERSGDDARALLRRNLAVLAAATVAAGLLLAVVFRYFIPLPTLAAGGRARFAVPLVALLLAQGIYAADTIATFRSVWLDVTRDNVGLLAQGLQRNLERVLGYGVPPERMNGIEAPFSRLAASFPAVAEIDLAGPDGSVLRRAGAQGALPVAPGQHAPARADDLTLVLPLRPDGKGEEAARLVLRLDASVISAGVRSRVLDAATVAAVALVAAIEMLLLLSLVMNRAFSARATLPDGSRMGPDDQPDVGRIARPVMFGFLFAWALPLGFMPLYARTLIEASGGTAGNLLMALPISVEMGCGLVTALVAGALTDRRGWQAPVIGGLAVSIAGTLLCAAAGNLIGFTVARGLVGLGYGLTWMGLQGFIVTRSPPGFRGRNMASVVAGLFAGHLSGAAVGAMLMEQAGFRPVFVVGALMLLLPLAGVLTLMRPYMGVAGAPVRPAAAAHRSFSGWLARTGQTLRLLNTRDFGLLLAGSVVPFSLAQVGLLSYALPLYLEAEGAAASSVGRVLMLYGLCVIYVGPLMGRLADGSDNKKSWIVIGGLVGSAGMLGMYFGSGLLGAALAVLMLAVASCFAGASQSAYMLALDDVQRYGAAGATSVMRAADKLGQMAGPLFVGSMFTLVGMSGGLALTGVIYLAATLAFLLFAPGRVPPARRAAQA